MLEFDLKNRIFYDGKQTTPVYVVPKPQFPTEKKKVVDPKLTEKGKHKSKKPVPKGQIKLPW